MALSLLSGELRPSPEAALVLEDDAGLCGYALALIDAKEAAATSQVIRRSFRGRSCRVAWWCLSLCLRPPEGSQSFSAGGVPLPGQRAASAPGHRLLPSKADDVPAPVLHQGRWYVSNLSELMRNHSFVVLDGQKRRQSPHTFARQLWVPVSMETSLQLWLHSGNNPCPL